MSEPSDQNDLTDLKGIDTGLLAVHRTVRRETLIVDKQTGDQLVRLDDLIWLSVGDVFEFEDVEGDRGGGWDGIVRGVRWLTQGHLCLEVDRVGPGRGGVPEA